MQAKHPRKKFVVSTTGIVMDPDFKVPGRVLPEPEKDDAHDVYDILVDASEAGITAIVHAHQQRSTQFIAAVAKGIGKKPEDLVVNCYKEFVEFLEHWAANEKARYTISPKIRLGSKLRIGAGPGSDNPTEGEETEQEEAETPPFRRKPKREIFKEPDPFLEVSDPPETLQPEQFDTLFRDFWSGQISAGKLSDDDIFLNYLKYLIFKARNPTFEDQDLFKMMGLMRVDFTGLNYNAVGFQSQPFGSFKEFFLDNSRLREATSKPSPAPAPKPPVSPKTDLTKIIETLFEASEHGVRASNLVEYYKYAIIPGRYSNLLFGPDLLFGIGQSMQRLREAYKFDRTNDELFVEFINDEQWRDLFVNLVVGVINLQQKISSFSPPQGIIRMIQSSVELTVGKFSTFKKFHRQSQAKRTLNY